MPASGITSIALLAAFVFLGYLNPFFDGLNLSIRRWVNRTRVSALRPLMILTHRFNDVLSVSIQLLALGLFIGFIFKDWYRATLLTSTLLVQTAIVGVAKRMTAVDRPPQAAAYVIMTSGSYPSGHSSISLSFALLVPTILNPFLPLAAIWLMGGYLMISAILTAYGRLYLDVHWLSDIIGGWLLAVATYLAVRLLL
ncbi:MAG: phosphatase PAP2 family protein [Clostridiaceae bacterium]|nr:phosphatase PAP2 family protein [Clostridiaceae bacterium]